jgi:hypothetical protein
MSLAMLAMVLDMDVECHKRELREAFAALRKELLPEREPTEAEKFAALMQSALAPSLNGYGQLLSSLQAQGAFPSNNPYVYGVGGALWGAQSCNGFGGRWF